MSPLPEGRVDLNAVVSGYVDSGFAIAHTALISDDWRRSDLRDRDGVHVDEAAIGWQGLHGMTMQVCSFDSGNGVTAPRGGAAGPETRRGCRGFLAPRSS
jgi:hypothetical protein